MGHLGSFAGLGH